MFFLLVYDRERGRLLEQRVFAHQREALAARFEAERSHLTEGFNVEVAVVAAESLEELKRTHGRYFMNLDELTGRTILSVR